MSVDMQRMIDTAVSFFLAGERCKPEFSFGSYPRHYVAAPTITNYALAIELALKILARTLGGETAGHDLKKLFESLPDAAKSNLRYLEDAFDDTPTPFVDWRYPFEKDFLTASPDTLRRAFIVCHREIRRTSPNLISVYERDWGGFDPDWNWAWPEMELKGLDSTP